MEFKKLLVKLFLRFGIRKTKNVRVKRNINSIHLFYRICDFGYPKQKPDYITKENCLKNAIISFPLNRVNWHIVADNVCDETYQMILKYVPEELVERVSVGHGAGTFRMVYRKALELQDNDLIYFLEDDYLHQPESLDCLIDCAKCNYEDYITLYDHPDKYDYFGGYSLLFSKRELYFTGSHHWKTTSSTTMTFASFVDVLKRDQKVFMRWTETKHPYDFQLFVELFLFKKARLLSPIPSLSTHGETQYLAPGIDWESLCCYGK